MEEPEQTRIRIWLEEKMVETLQALMELSI